MLRRRGRDSSSKYLTITNTVIAVMGRAIGLWCFCVKSMAGCIQLLGRLWPLLFEYMQRNLRGCLEANRCHLLGCFLVRCRCRSVYVQNSLELLTETSFLGLNHLKQKVNPNLTSVLFCQDILMPAPPPKVIYRQKVKPGHGPASRSWSKRLLLSGVILGAITLLCSVFESVKVA